MSVSTAPKKGRLLREIRRHWILYVFLLPAFLYLALFAYAPMYGIQIAFKLFSTVLINTVVLSLYGLIAGFPMPIILALSLNYVKNMKFKRTLQTVTYLPHFISTVVMVGMLSVFLSPRSGFVNTIIQALTGNTIYFFGAPEYFRHLYV